MKAKRFQAYIDTAIVIVIWGIASVVLKYTLQGIAPLPFLTYRFILATLVALPFLPSVFKLFHHKKLRALILIYGVLSATVGLGILFFALDKTSVINLALVTSLSPLLLAYLAHRFFHDHLSKRGKIGVFFAVIGALITLIEPTILNYEGGTMEGNLLLFMYVAVDLICIMLLKKLMREKVSAQALTNLSFVIAFVTFTTITVVTGALPNLISIVTHLEPRYHAGVIYMALLSGTIAYSLRAKAQKTLTVTETSIFGYVSPIISTVLAIIFLNEHITPLFVVGALCIGFGVFLVEYRKSHR